jgi:tight adherence protein C
LIVLLLIVLFAVVAVGLGAWSVSTSLETKAATRRSMEAVEGYAVVNVREQEMMEPVGERLIAPIGKRLLDFARNVTPTGYVDNLKRNIVYAGNPPGYEVDRILVLKVLGAASGILWILGGYLLLSDSPLIMLLVIGLGWGVSFFGPDLVLSQRIDTRRYEMQRTLPDTLDLLVISVEAGLGFEQALDRTAEAIPGALSDEFRRMLQETRMGASRADAMRALDERTNVDELRTFIVAMLQADTFGVSVSRILRTQADEMRVRRRQQVQEVAQKAPIKMLFPLVLCIFPATLIVVVVPGLIRILDAL